MLTHYEPKARVVQSYAVCEPRRSFEQRIKSTTDMMKVNQGFFLE